MEEVTTPEIKHYTKKDDLKRFLYPQEWKSIYDIANDRQRFTLNTLINTGARINEARHIKIEDIDFVRKNIILRVTKVRAKLKETRPSPRTIPVSSQYIKYLKAYINQKSLAAIDTLPIHSTEAVDFFLKDLGKEVGVKDYSNFSAHNIRKTCGNYLLALGVDGFKVAQFLGHSPSMLANTYASPDIFNFKDRDQMKDILGDLYLRLRGEI